MGACYGVGILGMIPGDVLKNEDDRLNFLHDFAALGFSHKFREIIGERVAEFNYKKDHVAMRWLAPEEAAPILMAAKSIGGSAPYSLFPWSLEEQIMTPGYRGSRSSIVKLPAWDVDDYSIQAIRNAIENTEEIVYMAPEDQEIDIEFCKGLLAQMRICREHRLNFSIGY